MPADGMMATAKKDFGTSPLAVIGKITPIFGVGGRGYGRI
jgi:hypothetical protein